MHSSTERALWLARYVLPHEPALRAWLQRKRVPGLEIDDIVQETYTRLSTVQSVADIRDPKTYMFQAAHSIIVSHVRRSRIVPILAVGSLEAFDLISEAPSVEAQASDHQQLQRLAEAIATLPGKIRDVFILRRIHDMPQREVAQRLGLSESTVEKHLSKGLRLLAALFDRSGNGPSRASNRKHKPEEGTHSFADRRNPSSKQSKQQAHDNAD